jgi:hypothetical protein
MKGPVDRFSFAPGRFVDLYLIRFDKDGKLLSPKTFDQFLAGGQDYTDVFVFSHGWNNIYAVAKHSYTKFIQNYIEQRKELDLPLPENYRPALLGIIWPSTSFVFPWESGPLIAATDDENERRNQEGRDQEEMLDLILDSLNDEQAVQFAEYVDHAGLVYGDDAEAMAKLVQQTLIRDGDPDAGAAPTASEIIDACNALDQLGGAPVEYGDDGDFGTGPSGAHGSGDPSQAGGLKTLDPRTLLRYATVWKMKGRAGVVGAIGVGPRLREILSKTQACLHLIGHSFGARVVLAAITSAEMETQRKVRSVLLLQPAINRWCFASEVAPLATKTKNGPPGGYRVALSRVETPIFTTYSDEDVPLHDIFHLVVRSNVGEVTFAAIGDTERYGALGGYGPAGLDKELTKVQVLRPGTKYEFDKGCQVLAIDGSKHDGTNAPINGHGDVITTFTAWMLHSQIAGTTAAQDL